MIKAARGFSAKITGDKMLFDNHMHTSWSGDSEADPHDMIQSAKNRGLSGITITDHLDWDFSDMPHTFDLDIENYFPCIKSLAEDVSDSSFTMLTGLELGLQTHLADRHRKLLSEYHPDFVIGSIHQVDGKDPYFDTFWEGKDYKSTYERYFEITLDNIRAFSGFDSLGHLDYISRYGQQAALKNANNTGESALNYDDYNELIDEILLFLIRHDKALEVNTAPYRHNLPEPNPSRRILQRYHELGGRLITTGADAHTPSDIAIGFDTLKDLLKNAGFSSFFVYKERKPIEYPL